MRKPHLTAALMAAFTLPLGAATPDYPDPLLTMPVTQEKVAAGLEADAYQNGLMAYVWGYPLVRMERIVRQYIDVPVPNPPTSYRAPLNQLGWATELGTPDTGADMPTANNDTLYLSAVVKLDEPYVLHVPDTHDRYYVVNVFDMWQNLQHYIGRRVTGTQAGDFALVPPGWKGELPAGMTRLDANTDKVWLWGRLRVDQGEDMAPLHALQKGFSLRPLSHRQDQDYQAPAATLPALPGIQGDELGFLRHLAAALQANRIPAPDAALFGQFARIGLTEKGFDPSKLTPPQRKGLQKALEDGPKVAISAMATAAVQNNGWVWATGLDRFTPQSYPLRALVAGPYLGGQGEKEAMYPLRYTDSKGETLDGNQGYVMRFPKMPPVDAFWSLTAYDAKTKNLVTNEIQRYHIGPDTPGLEVSTDGSFAVPISATKPGAASAANWLPAPKGPFYLIFRLYQPKEEVLSGRYALPQVEKVK